MEVKNEKVKKQKVKVGAKRMLCWQSSSLSSGCNMLALGFIAIYCTDTLGMPAALVGTLLMASKIFDGVTDLIAGYIVDNTKSRWGRGRPYELCLIGAWFCTVLLYSCPPQFSLAAKAIWLFVMYALVNSVFQTFLKASSTVYMVRAFDREEHYVALSSYGGIITMFGAVILNVTFPILMGTLATSAAGWRTLILIYAVPLTALGMLRFFFIKETNMVDVESESKVRLKEMLLVLKNNRYIYAVALMTFAMNFVTNLGIQVYYFTYIVDNIAIMSVLAFTQILALPFVFIFPAFIRKFSTKQLMVTGLLLMAFANAINFIAYDNVLLLVIAAILQGVGSIAPSMMVTLLIIECAEYNEWKGMPRLEGTLSCVNGFASKVGAGIGTGVTGVLLGMSGYISAAGSTQPDSALLTIRLLFSMVPMGLYLLVALSMKFYKLNKMMPQIRKENEERRNAVLETGGQK